MTSTLTLLRSIAIAPVTYQCATRIDTGGGTPEPNPQKTPSESLITRSIVRLVALAALSFVSIDAAAQCVTGVGTGGGPCIPPDAAGMPGYNSNTNQAPPPPAWQSTWGAIALDTVDGGKGVTTGQATKSAATDAALSECASSGAQHCRVVFTYSNQCAAIAWGDYSFGKAAGASIGEAEREAVTECTKVGAGCKPVYSACSPARRLRN